jgi:hypothetical protein
LLSSPPLSPPPAAQPPLQALLSRLNTHVTVSSHRFRREIYPPGHTVLLTLDFILFQLQPSVVNELVCEYGDEDGLGYGTGEGFVEFAGRRFWFGGLLAGVRLLSCESGADGG